jgi:hypothetical protein
VLQLGKVACYLLVIDQNFVLELYLHSVYNYKLLHLSLNTYDKNGTFAGLLLCNVFNAKMCIHS